MDNITKINDIKYLIMEFYSDQEPLTEEQQKSKECFFRYCDEIRDVLKAFDALSKDDEKAKKLLSKEIEKNRALNEILALHDKWLGFQMSDFEFFTLLSEIKAKYDL